MPVKEQNGRRERTGGEQYAAVILAARDGLVVGTKHCYFRPRPKPTAGHDIDPPIQSM